MNFCKADYQTLPVYARIKILYLSPSVLRVGILDVFTPETNYKFIINLVKSHLF